MRVVFDSNVLVCYRCVITKCMCINAHCVDCESFTIRYFALTRVRTLHDYNMELV